MIALICSGCQNKLSVDADLAVKGVTCPACGQVMTAPTRARPRIEDLQTMPPSVLEPCSPDQPLPLNAGDPPTDPPLSTPDATAAFDAHEPEDAPNLTGFLAPPQAKDELGRLGKYRILKVLGHGGMGVVYQAEDIQLKRTVALKAMLPGLAANASAGKRFLREAEAMAAVEHDHIVRIYQIDQDRGVPFLAMEFLKGESLETRLRRAGPLPVPEMLRIGREIARALDAAHQRGLIHRDIKPANIWLEAPEGRVKILDFGLARAAAAQDANLTQQGTIVGTPAYMAPEQGRGEAVDAHCDLFSLGVVLYRLCTGRLPFKARDAVSTLMAVATHAPTPPIDLNAELPQALSDLVMRLLEKDRDWRPESAGAVVQVLQTLEKKWAQTHETDDHTVALSADELSTEPHSAAGLSTPVPARAPVLSRRLTFGVLAATAALALVMVGTLALVVAGIVLFWPAAHGTVQVQVAKDGKVIGEMAELPPPVVPRDPDLASFDEMMERFVQDNEVPGATLAVAKDGRLVYARGFGYADPEAKTAMPPRALFRIAGISQSITAAAILRLSEMGKLKLDDAAFELLKPNPLPGADPDPRLKSVTIRALLQHTGGFDRDLSFDPMFQSFKIARAAQAAPPANPEHIIRYMMGQKLDFDPGSRYAYSNFGYCVLGRVIERASGKTYEAFIRDAILAPLALGDTRLGKTLERADGEVRYIDLKGRTAPAVVGPQQGQLVPLPYGTWSLEALDGWLSSAPDLVRFAASFDRPDQCPILTADSIRTMFARPAGEAGNDNEGRPLDTYDGCGWAVRVVNPKGAINTWSIGVLDGTATVLVRRHDGLCWAVLFNARENARGENLAQLIDPLVHQAAERVKRWPTTDMFKKGA